MGIAAILIGCSPDWETPHPINQEGLHQAFALWLLYPELTKPPLSGHSEFVGTWQASNGWSWEFDYSIRATRRDPYKSVAEWQVRDGGIFCTRLWEHYGTCAGYDCGFACRTYSLTGSAFSWDGQTYQKTN